MEENQYYSKIIDSPVGKLKLIGSVNGLHSISWFSQEVSRFNLTNLKEDNNFKLFKEVEDQLKEYFHGKRKDFSLQLDLGYGTDFQRKVWKALTEIPYGEVRSYGQQAVKVGSPKAFRAVGSANGKNLIPIIIPCHRVIASGGKLGGFGGGLENKQILLDLEKKYQKS